MPIVDAKEGGQLDTSIAELLAAPTDRQEQLLRRILVERLDFEPTSGTVPIPPGRLTDLPDTAVRIASVGGIQVLLVTVPGPKITATVARAIIKALSNQVDEHLLVARTEDGALFHFIYPRSVGSRTVLKRIVLERGRPRRTAVDRLFTLYDERARNGVDVRTAIERAFDVEAVTREFYKGYETLFGHLESEFQVQSGDNVWAHDYALQLLNRVMFLYFIDRKGWLETEFLRRFWQAYRQSGEPADTFFDKWLKVLFFEAFNNRFSHPSYMPSEIRDTLQSAPWLNGGLFQRNKLDEGFDPKVNDELWRRIMGFFDSYNFTIAESTPWDQEVAVDPAMIGKVYESLVNVSEVDERGEAGIFYTPRTEIDLMCRLALVDYLANHLGKDRKSLLYNVVFAVEPDEKEDADRQLRDENLWPDFDRLIQVITVADPACGSGSFLVGMLQVLDDLFVRADSELGRQETAYERKKRIIGRSLCGVDVMEWAVDVAELRLWLQLVIDTEITWEERKLRPLLPSLSFKIRCGDSLVQEVGGVNMAHTHGRVELPAQIKGKLTKLQGEKLRHYNNEKGALSEEDLAGRELELFRSVLEHRVDALRTQVREKQGRLEAARTEQGQLPGMARERGRQASLEETRLLEEITRLESDLAQVGTAKDALVSGSEVPFVWDIAFVEVFAGDRQGFDIVIGNPPYVADENIADPTLKRHDINAKNNKAYRSKLATSVYRTFPRYFGYSASTNKTTRRIDAKSDLYVYFYFHGLSLLNDSGAFCFITSNSWLDVGYGAVLQEFMLRHCHLQLVLDNQARRSFATADINTVIVLVSAADEGSDWGLDCTARFVMFKLPFEHVSSAVIFDEISSANDRKTTVEYRIHPETQKALLEDGCESALEGDEVSPLPAPGPAESRPAVRTIRYNGAKWGGNYLRAPDVALRLIDLARVGRLAPLRSVNEVRLGLMTGANDFFYLIVIDQTEEVATCRTATGDIVEIETQYLRPVLRGPRACDELWLSEEALRQVVFYCNAEPSELVGTRAWKYVKRGEETPVVVKQGREKGLTVTGYHRLAFFSSRRLWYAIGTQDATDLVCIKGVGEAHKLALMPTGGLFDQRFYGLRATNRNRVWGMALALLSTVWVLFRELYGRSNLGAGALDVSTLDMRRTLIPSLNRLPSEEECEALLKRLVGRKWTRVQDELISPDRQAIDSACFDAMGLSQSDREAVCEAVLNLVEARLAKAASV